MLECVEVFCGVSVFLNGVVLGGSGLGGLVNIVFKCVGDDLLNCVMFGYEF